MVALLMIRLCHNEGFNQDSLNLQQVVPHTFLKWLPKLLADTNLKYYPPGRIWVLPCDS